MFSIIEHSLLLRPGPEEDGSKEGRNTDVFPEVAVEGKRLGSNEL